MTLCQPAFAGSKIRITAIAVIDNGAAENSAPIPMVDTVRGLCGSFEDPTPEPFYDSVVSISVVNTTRTLAKFKSLSYSLSMNGVPFSSDTIAPGNFFEVPAGGKATLVASLFTRIDEGRKFFVGSSDPIPEYAGPIAVNFVLTGKRGRKKNVSVSATTTVSFSNYNRCLSQ